MPVTEVFAAITVRDRDAAIEFYERLLGAPPTMLPNDGKAAWQLTGGGWLERGAVQRREAPGDARPRERQ
jgi:catechol 2,3-dioxygenase-like lactoylglutathione lyase family enzyme